MTIPLPTRFLVFLLAGQALLQAAPLDVDSAKRILEAKWLQMKQVYVAERKVRFQDVRIVSESGGATVYTVTAIVWDRGKGNPRFRDWGETCISKFNAQTYTLSSRAGAWEIFGPLVEIGNCKKNPAEGVAGIPFESLPGSSAGSGPTTQAAPLVRSGGVGQGAYECWSFGSPRPLLDLRIQPGNRYVDSEGKPGVFAVAAADGRMAFRGGMWDGALPPGSYAVYSEPKGIPVISIRDTNNREFAYCEAK